MDPTGENTSNKSESGLTTKEALHQLHDDIEKVLNDYQTKQISSTSKSWLKDTFHHQSKYTTLNWITLTAILLSSIMLIVSYILLENSCQVLIYAAVIILLLISLNTYLVISNNKLRYNEIPHRVSAILATLKLAIANVKWSPENYPQLCSPYSPCVTMQWTYRDGAIVNLPWSLLVKGDIVIIRPGQVSPGLCKALDEDSECPILKAKEIYGPVVASVNEVFTVPKARDPLKNKKYCLMETPFLNNLKIALERGLDRPVSYYDQQRYLLVSICLERFTYPLILIFAIFFNFLRYMYLYPYVGRSNWIEMFLLQPTVTALPLLPLLFPIIWLTLNALGLARFKALFNETSKVPLIEKLEPFAEADSSKDSEPVFDYHLSEVWNIFLDIFTGRELMMCRSANILHVFGSLTALCVIDKKGILSWPNPTAEKVFFLRSSENLSPSSSLDSMADSNADADSIRTGPKQTGTTATKGTVTEVLDLTHGHNVPFQLEFDDHEWKTHLSNLKPLGLAILLNTCNLDTHEHYSQFCSHVTCEAMYNENLIPVTNRRCLCELAKQIGFVDQAKDIFRIEEQLSTYRHLQTDYVRRDKFARSLHLHTKLKFPFPHMMAVVMKELTSGSLQLLSQGTADIILDSCVDYWDGKDLCPLSPSDRKKVTDFYQRTSLTAYCTAFAYRPLTRSIDDRISKIYMELPSDCKHLYMPYRSPTPLQWDFKNILEPRFKGGLGQFHSTDSLLYNDPKEDAVADIEGCFETQCNQVFIGMVTMQYQAQSDMVHLIERLERACVRFVHFSKENELRSRVFSEKMGLESGWNCHISLLSERPKSDNAPSECWANNGTTRVCSPSSMPHRVVTRHSESDKQCSNETEKLLPSSNLESTKPRSLSAPSAINLDYSVVKFDEDPLEYGDGNGPMSDWSTGAVMGGGDKSEVTRDLTMGKDDGSDLSGSRDSVMVQSIDLSSHQEGWQSLSCLTDSTEQSAPVNFDMSNRAKLPRGIENIRPHLEEVDNVPLLVSLFTDCTVVVTHRMLRIMQDYGQTICVLGSASNAENIDLFMQGDASIAVEPLYPQVCQRVPVFAPVEPVFGPSPVTLSRTLNALPCSLAFKREDPVSIYHLMLEARHYMLAVSNCIQFWVCCVVTLSFLQLTGIILMLPPLLSIGQVIWLVCVVFPVLSFSLIGLPVDSQVMQKPSSKYQYTLNTDIALFVSWCYCAKFLPMAFIIVLCYVCTLIGFCHDIESALNTTSCVVLYPYSDGNESMWMGWTQYSYSLLVAQHVVVLLIVLHLLTISVCFVHREYSIWQQSPLTNKLWLFSVIIIFLLQILFTTIVLSVSDNYKALAPIFIDLPWPVMVFGVLSPVLSFGIVEFIKWQEIKINLRYQRRARLDFGTKLGMNSPF